MSDFMKRRRDWVIASCSLVFLTSLVWPHIQAAEDPPQPGLQTPVEFLRDVEPILHKNCYACHGPSQQMNGLRFDQKDAALKGGYSGPAFIPGNSGESKLIQKVASSKDGFKMPPAGPALSAREIGILRAWIDKGAEWPAPPPGTSLNICSEGPSSLAATAPKISSTQLRPHPVIQATTPPFG